MSGLKHVNLEKCTQLLYKTMPSMNELVRFFHNLQNNRRTLGMTTKRKIPIILWNYYILRDKRSCIIVAIRFGTDHDIEQLPLQAEEIMEEIEIGSRNLLRLFSEHFISINPNNLEVKKRPTGEQGKGEGLALKCIEKNICNLDLVFSFKA